MSQARTLHERLLFRIVRKKVAEAMSSLLKESGEFAKEFGAEAAEAKLVVLEMIRSAMGEIYLEQKARIEFAATKQFGDSGQE